MTKLRTFKLLTEAYYLVIGKEVKLALTLFTLTKAVDSQSRVHLERVGNVLIGEIEELRLGISKAKEDLKK